MERPRGQRVAITGIGIVSSLGHSIEEFWTACLAGCSTVETIPEYWRHYYSPKSRYWSPLTNPDYSKHGLRRSDILSHDFAVLNAIVAADDAISQAQLEKLTVDERGGRYKIPFVDPFRAGVFIGTGLGCITSAFQNYVPHLLSGIRPNILELREHEAHDGAVHEIFCNLDLQPRVSPVASCKSMANSISSGLAIRYNFRAANETFISACAAGATAISHAYKAITRGELDIALAGGSEYYGDRAGGVFMAFDRLNALAKPDLGPQQANRPFDKKRSGFLFSQGASCVLLLESVEHAARRAIVPFAKIVGTAATSDSRSLVAISRDDNAIEAMIRGALRSAGISAEDVDYVNSHGTSTEQNDEIEAEIIGKVFKPDVVVNSTKSLLGHTIGACGAIEAAVAALSIYSQEVHPSANIDDPVLDLNFSTQRMRTKIDYAFTHNFGFGGHNVGLVLSI